MSNSFGKTINKLYFAHKEKENLPLKEKHERFMECFCDLGKIIFMDALWNCFMI